jgi:hypothetical protein
MEITSKRSMVCPSDIKFSPFDSRRTEPEAKAGLLAIGNGRVVKGGSKTLTSGCGRVCVKCFAKQLHGVFPVMLAELLTYWARPVGFARTQWGGRAKSE